MSDVEDASELKTERDCLHWLANRASVPGVLEFVTQDGAGYLLTEALPGTSAAEAPARLWPRITEQLARQLRQLHSLDPEECPFDRTLDPVVRRAGARAASGYVDESDFDSERLGCNAMELFDSLCRERPQSEDVVVTHGDACLPNVIFDNGSFSGFVDCGRCGRADRYQDLALAHRSIEVNFGTGAAEGFLRAYGLEPVDTKKLSYYRLLDEFF
jgi:aminoglycoside phosphotransferase